MQCPTAAGRPELAPNSCGRSSPHARNAATTELQAAQSMRFHRLSRSAPRGAAMRGKRPGTDVPVIEYDNLSMRVSEVAHHYATFS